MLNSDRRFQSIHGLLLGIAIGDALAQPHCGLSRRAAVRKFARRPLRYRLWPGCGLYSDDTQLALMTGQAILQSRSQSNAFHRQFNRRLKWYALGLPVGISKSTFWASLKAWLWRIGLPAGSTSAECAPASRALLLGVVLHNTGHRYAVWSRDSATQTHRHPLAADGAAVLATAAQIAAVTSSGRLNSKSSLETLIKTAKEPELVAALSELQPFLDRNSSPRAVARHFKWGHGTSRSMLPTTVMAAYCFLRYPDDFQRALKWTLMLSGTNDTLPALVAGLVGAHIGASALPDNLVEGLADWPHDREWIERLATRLADWPHGVDDLLMAPSLRSHPFSQVLRNLFRWPVVILHKLVRLPCP